MPTLVFVLTVATVVLWGGATVRVWLVLPPHRQPLAVAYLAVPVVALAFVAFGGEAVGDMVTGLATIIGLVFWLSTGLKPERAVEFRGDEPPERITHRTGQLLLRRQLSVVGAVALLTVVLAITLPWLRDVPWFRP
ncbi:hypothetical protein [Kutzneria buriramensis]|uniref:Uncharacterized protein n=1 Tax=Kutzneria buriramensis TaxID=1045776 RepID=A0A3E0HZI1_9PSEU|nr:hypothetical protein [Kutzneria buriramensis]REH51676.1 hypothetical protein BCF44_103125 [Kutzneria buriramensis]